MMSSDFLMQFLSSPVARYLLVPPSIMIIASVVKYASQNDKYATFGREFFYWGEDLCITGLITLFVDFSCNLDKIESKNQMSYCFRALLMVLLCGIVLFILSLMIRKFGWTNKNRGLTRHMCYGIIIPNIVGFVMLFLLYKFFAI